MDNEYRTITIPNIPSLNETVEINYNSFNQCYKDLDSGIKQIINDFSDLLAEFRKLLIGKVNEKREAQYSYYVDSLDIFILHFVASLERILQRHIASSLMHCRLAIEISILLYLLHKNDINFKEIVEGKKDKKSGKIKPVSIYSFKDKFINDDKLSIELRKYPLIHKETLEFLDLASNYAIHPNWEHVTHQTIMNHRGRRNRYFHYPLSKNQMRTKLLDVLDEMLACIGRYIQSCSTIIGYEGIKDYPYINRVIHLRALIYKTR